MVSRSTARAASLLVLLLWIPAATAQDVPKSGNAVFDKTVELVDQHFFSQAVLPKFHEAASGLIAEASGADKPLVLDGVVTRLLASLNASHTARLTADRVDYYEVADIFRYAIRDNLARMFAPDGKVTYDGIGIASARIGDGTFVTDVYDGGPASRAGLEVGDEILSADGQPFAEIESFRGKAGKTVDLDVLRRPGGSPTAIAVSVESLHPQETFLKAISDSVRVIDRDGRKIGVVRIWSYTSDQVTGILYKELATRLKDVDGLVLDLRGRWGGAPADAAETFVGGTADMQVIDHDGDMHYVNARFHKPMVAIIDEGTRSGMEILAYSLKKNGIPLVGTATAGDVLAATAYLLPDDSLLELAVQDVLVEGNRMESNPVTPDIAVPFDLRYAAGNDPQFDAAMAEMSRRLSAGVN